MYVFMFVFVFLRSVSCQLAMKGQGRRERSKKFISFRFRSEFGRMLIKTQQHGSLQINKWKVYFLHSPRCWTASLFLCLSVFVSFLCVCFVCLSRVWHAANLWTVTCFLDPDPMLSDFSAPHHYFPIIIKKNTSQNRLLQYYPWIEAPQIGWPCAYLL